MFPKAWIIVFLSIAVTCPLLAQEGPPPQEPKTSPLTQKIDVDFPGGTINEFLKTIKVANDIIPNVIVSKEAGQVVLPAIRLSSVTVSDAMNGLKLMREIDQNEIRVSEGPNVITIHAYPSGRPHSVSTQVFTVESLLSNASDGANYTIDDIVTAITTAWKMNPEERSAEIKYHNETKLLLVVGSKNQLDTVQDVLRRLEEALRARKGDGYQRNIQMVTAELTEVQNSVAQLKEENRQLKAQLDALIKTLKSR
jgi:hypothetical protein